MLYPRVTNNNTNINSASNTKINISFFLINFVKKAFCHSTYYIFYIINMEHQKEYTQCPIEPVHYQE